MAQGKFTDKQVKQLRKIEAFRAAKGLAGYEDFFESIILSLLENEGLTREDLDDFQIKPENIVIKESFDELLNARRYEFVNAGFTEEKWPLEPVEPDEDEWEVDVRHFLESETFNVGLDRLRQMEARGEIKLLTGSRRAMKWIAEHPDEQMKYPIILPLCSNVFRALKVPVFGHGKIWGGTGPRLHLYSLDELIAPMHRWLVLHKKTAVTTTTPKESFAELLAVCNLVNTTGVLFNEIDWPLEPVEPDEDDWEVDLHQFPYPVILLQEGFYLLRQMEARGEIKLLKGSRRAMKWIAEHPDAQEDYPIILSLHRQERVGSFPVFHYDLENYDRTLALRHSVDEVDPDYRWLVLRKKILF